jgi:hypothetical protein
MNRYVLLVKSRLLVPVILRWRGFHGGVMNFMATVRVIPRDTRVLLSHLSADFVPGFYWRRIKRFIGAR